MLFTGWSGFKTKLFIPVSSGISTEAEANSVILPKCPDKARHRARQKIHCMSMRAPQWFYPRRTGDEHAKVVVREVWFCM